MASNSTWMTVVWERANKHGKWTPYAPEVSQLLEQSHRKNLNIASLGDADVNLKIYSVNLKDMVQVSEATGTKLPVRRRLCESNSVVLGRGFTWEWHGDSHDTWHPYDTDVNNFIENAFLQGVKFLNLSKSFPGYNYDIDLIKMLQMNRRTKHKRTIRRKQNISPYPVVKCPEEEEKNTEVESCVNGNYNALYSDLAQEIPGTASLIEQANRYMQSVIKATAPELPNNTVTLPSQTSGNGEINGTSVTIEMCSQNSNKLLENSNVGLNTTTTALVNGKPWREPWPPHTPESKLKPVPGIAPLPKYDKKAAKKKGLNDNDSIGPKNILELYTEKIEISPLSDSSNQTCIICCEMLSNPSSYDGDSTVLKLQLCSHMYHKACLQAMYDSGPKDKYLQCPTCKKIHGEKCGIQPPGNMIYHVLPYSLPGFPECDTIRIIYDIPSGVQGPEHPKPGKRYTARGFPRHCYLPDNEIGRKVLRLLVKAWQRRLIFTVGRSSTTGEENTVTWNEIHHKTEFGCNRRGHGYPDPNYFSNILAELEAHGVTDDEVYLWYPA
ncbi:Protein deltex-2, partial [Stegodyphus mimosarum]